MPDSSIKGIRKQLIHDKELLDIKDLGAGSRIHASKRRTVHQLAKTAVKSKKLGELFFRLAAYYQPRTVIELGTSLGLTTAYLATANPNATIITIEGSDAILIKAKTVFQTLGINNIDARLGNFDSVLPQVLEETGTIDMAYVDGNHRYEPTIRYFHQLLSHAHNDTILIFDDIHWSAEMEKAWKEIQQHPSVRCTVDIFYLGFVFLRDEFKVPQHFVVRF
ncbi:MAG TPA: class I SAM-dependent methyltransferase [Flavisolibacter sp.]|nr:class I SAM-dependent methyltransferase [Flavisolibacter sp.]